MYVKPQFFSYGQQIAPDPADYKEYIEPKTCVLCVSFGDNPEHLVRYGMDFKRACAVAKRYNRLYECAKDSPRAYICTFGYDIND